MLISPADTAKKTAMKIIIILKINAKIKKNHINQSSHVF